MIGSLNIAMNIAIFGGGLGRLAILIASIRLAPKALKQNPVEDI